MSVPIQVLRDLSLLRELPDETLSRLAGLAVERAFSRREVVLNKGTAANALGFLVEGRLQGADFTVDGREVGLYFVEPGDYFAELSVIDNQPQAEFIIALSRARVVWLPRKEARELFFATAGIAEQVFSRLARRLREAAAQKTILGLGNPLQKVCAQLLQLAQTSGNASSGIANPPTHQEIAIMINTSRETVTRVFQQLQAKGILSRDGNHLTVINLQFLRNVSEGKEDPEQALRGKDAG